MGYKKNKLKLDVDSALALMQEIYNDIVEQKNIASLITKKMLTFMKDSEDMSVIGPVIKDQQRILNDCTEKKISLVKIQNSLLKQTEGNNKEKFSRMSLSDEDKAILEKLMSDTDKKDNNTDKGKYTIE